MSKLWLFGLQLVYFSLASIAFSQDYKQLVFEEKYEQALQKIDESDHLSPERYYCETIASLCLFEKSRGIRSARKLLEFDQIPKRYRWIANHAIHHLENLEEDSVGHVAELMKDSERRLRLGRAGPKVQNVQAKTVAILDYLIEKIENSESGSDSCPCKDLDGQGKTHKSEKPAEISKVAGKSGKGNVDKKRITGGGAWGSLPKKEQAKAKQYADKHYPPHYKKIIEEYSKRLAEQKRKKLR